jgi:hypothetical protein
LESLISVVDFAALLIWLWAIPTCFLKGRARVGWFGIVMFASGAVLTITASRYQSNGSIDDWWWWIFILQGLFVLAFVAATAWRRAKPGSWWIDHRP